MKVERNDLSFIIDPSRW